MVREKSVCGNHWPASLLTYIYRHYSLTSYQGSLNRN